MLSRKSVASLALVLLLAAMPAIAEDQHHPAAPGMGMTGQMPMMGNGQMMGQYGMMGMQMMAQHVEGRIAFLKTELKITDAQLPQWNAFAQALRDRATAMQGMQSTMMGMMNQGGTLPDKLTAQEKFLADRLEAIRKQKTAAGPLYASLSDDQKKSADELMIGPMGVMMGMGMM